MSIDATTGEIVPVDRSNAAAVIGYLENARTWLSTAVEETGPEQIAMAKAQIATAAEATKQLNLSREIQLDAQEMVRRAEYALGKSIRKGQEEGTIYRRGDRGPDSGTMTRGGVEMPSGKQDLPHKKSTSEFYSGGEEAVAVKAMSGTDDDQFDAAIDEAKAEGNLSRANVVRKIKKNAGPKTRDQRADQIADLAEEGYSSRQIAAKVGVSEQTVRQIARDYDMEIAADKVIGKTRRHDSTRIVQALVEELASMPASIDLIDYSDLDSGQAWQWANSLDESFKVLNRFRKQIKELTQ